MRPSKPHYAAADARTSACRRFSDSPLRTPRHTGAMDPALALIPLGPPPQSSDGQVLVVPGAYLPVLLPLVCYAPAQRMRVLAAIADAPLAARVQAALEARDLAEAWREAASWRGPLSSADGLEN